jgi:hypothetical protein
MAAIALPAWATLKTNIVAILRAVAAEEAAVDARRNFRVSNSRWRPWIESQQNVALVNVMIDAVEPDTTRSGTRRYKTDLVTVNLDLYALGTYEEQAGVLTPADEVAALRLDLLAAQVRSAITRMKNTDLGFTTGSCDSLGVVATLQIYSQEREESIGQYAPARWTFAVAMPYYPEESTDGVALSELNIEFSRALESWGLKYSYSHDE